MLVCKIRKVLICVCTSCRGDTEVVYKRGGPASRIYACTSSYISIVQLLFHGEPLKLANGLDMVSPLLLVLIYILVGGGG